MAPQSSLEMPWSVAKALAAPCPSQNTRRQPVTLGFILLLSNATKGFAAMTRCRSTTNVNAALVRFLASIYWRSLWTTPGRKERTVTFHSFDIAIPGC